MRILDVRGKSGVSISELEKRYTPDLYSQMATRTAHWTAEADIKEFEKTAREAGAEAVFIYSRSQLAYIPLKGGRDIIRGLPPIEGTVYRVDIPNWGIPDDAAAADVVRFEQEELGNQMGVSADLVRELEKYSHHDVVWVTRDKADAEVYLSEGMTRADISEIKLEPGSRIVCEDGFGGYLVLHGSARRREAMPQTVPVDKLFGRYQRPLPPEAY